jgi:hypothetical protein
MGGHVGMDGLGLRRRFRTRSPGWCGDSTAVPCAGAGARGPGAGPEKWAIHAVGVIGLRASGWFRGC